MKKLSREKITKLQHFAKNGISLNKLSKATGISKTTIYYHTKNFGRKMGKFDIEKLTRWETGYVIGFFAGDGCANVNKEYSYKIRFYLNKSKEKKIDDFLKSILVKCGSKPFNQINKNVLILVVSSKPLFELIRRHITFRKGKEKKSRRKILINYNDWSEETKYGFIAGFIDSDGYIGFHRNSINVIIRSSSLSLIKKTSQILNSLGIRFSVYSDISRQYNSLCYSLRVWSNSFKEHSNNIKSIKWDDLIN